MIIKPCSLGSTLEYFSLGSNTFLAVALKPESTLLLRRGVYDKVSDVALVLVFMQPVCCDDSALWAKVLPRPCPVPYL